MPKKLSQDLKDRILSLYDSGVKIIRIAELIEKPYPTIVYILKKERKYSNPRPSQGNINYFNKIDTYSKAYLLGFIAADGCINKRKGLYTLTIAISQKDLSILNFLKSEIGFETKILLSDSYDKRTNKTYKRASISLGNQTLCKDLLSLGIYERKTFSLPNFLLSIPKKFRKSAILGYFDGDGCISSSRDKKCPNPNYKNYSITICGTFSICEGIAFELELSSYKIYTYKSHCVLSFASRDDFFKLYSCYEHLTFFLQRKNKIFLERINYDRTISRSFRFKPVKTWDAISSLE